MSDIKLFEIPNGKAKELKGLASDLEKSLQNLMEDNLESLLGVRFLASEYSTGKTHGGRIDSLGLDENACPVIIEYKRYVSENVINQGLFYLDWLMDHQAEFQLLVMEKLGKDIADTIDWSAPRLICIASDFTRYDSHAVQQMNHNIELVRYKKFGEDLLLLELVNATTATSSAVKSTKSTKVGSDRTSEQSLAEMDKKMSELFEALEAYILSFGDDVQRKDLKLYIAFKRLRNFISVIIQKSKFILILSLDPDSIEPIEGLTRDVREIGHWGTGSLEITLTNSNDLEKAKPLLRRAYEGQ